MPPLTRVTVRSYSYGFTPTNIAGCKLWLDGADPAAVILDGGYVDSWIDKSGLGNDYLPAAVLYDAPYLSFNGTSSQLSHNGVIVDTNWSIFIVAKTTDTAYMSIMDFGADGIRRIAVYEGDLSVGAVVERAYPAGKVNTGAPFIAEYFRTSSSGLITGAITGGSFNSIIGPTGTISDLELTAIGATNNAQDYFNGFIGEVIIYDSVLTQEKRQLVETYLTQKWNFMVGLPNGHPGKYGINLPVVVPIPFIPDSLHLINCLPFSEIVYDNLFWYLDTTDGSSYPGYGTKWYNLINDNYPWGAIFSGSPTFVSAFGGLIYFNPATFDYAESVASLTDGAPIQNYTVEVWYYYNNTNTGSYQSIIAEEYNNTLVPPYTAQNYAIDFDTGELVTYSYSSIAGNGTGYFLPSVGWYHIVASYDSKILRLYINNKLVSSAPITFSTASSGLATVLMAAYDLEGGYTGGYLSKVRIYKKALNVNEIDRNYSVEKARYFNGRLNFGSSIDHSVPAGDPRYGSYDLYYTLIWGAVSGATAYTVTSDNGADLVVQANSTSLIARVYLNSQFDTLRLFTVTATISGGAPVSESLNKMPCFLAGSLVQMADGTTKVIEDVKVGDLVLGAFGEINTVLFLHRPTLGEAQMCKINDEHITTNHHPHISLDKKFYCGDPERVSTKTYGQFHRVINEKGNHQYKKLHGLKKERIQKLTVGTELKTVEGSRVVTTLEVYSMPPETQLYNLVVGGSHTYHVEGYAVTGWPREDDFNYDTWTAI
jgi:Concanavalin A-like lectin/glucanases superfamily/Hom_end-associated Hint